ncbi:Putative oxidoreductase CatD [Variovorax sp. SRS16]|uniref:DoxX family protein n=1 Tax=Variovorax sp. SRS16 TaxID=282217 RepID=UPI00131994F3|nr:DoxX family protein [Variovorax sp. SRS16]VTU28593.1 Putative oxidoreductase CatD [Variovorax sp. SRS16]
MRSDDAGKLVLRLGLGLGLIILVHGISKLSGGVDFISGLLASHGLPPALAYLVYVGEIVAPLLLVVGLYSRPAAWIVVINMVVAIGLARYKDMFVIGKAGGWALELEGLLLISAVAVALLGAGRFSLGGSDNKLN